MNKPTFADRLRYEFDNTMSKGTISLIAWLGIISVVFVLIVSLIVFVTGISQADDREALDYSSIVWMSLMRTLDAGTMGGDTGSFPFLLSMFLITIGGIFLVSTLIGVLTSGIESRMEELRKGRSFVIESGHTLILGWSEQVFTVISELVQANANQPRSCLVVLADMDKVEMEDEIRSKVGSTHRTRIVCRSGSSLDPTDLEMVNPNAAKSIIILAPAVSDPDTHVIKTLLALTNGPDRKKEPYHIVAEIHDPKNMQVAQMVGRDEAQIVLIGDLISRITVQTCRQSGLSVVYTELLNYGGDEIYFKPEPALQGKTFADALMAYDESSVLGLQSQGRGTMLNPPMDTVIQPGDQIIVISADDDTIKLSGLGDYGIDAAAIRSPVATKPAPEATLILGWNVRGPSVVRELDNYVAAGSTTTLVANIPDLHSQVPPALKNQSVVCQTGDTTNRGVLDSLNVGRFDHIIVMSYSDQSVPEEADSQTLITLLHLRDLGEKLNRDLAIVSEMLDVRNRQLAEVTRADDFIVSDQLISLMLSQISENKHLTAVFADLFDPEGSEIYLKPAEQYIQAGTPVNFYTVVESARRRNEVAIGFKLGRDAHDPAKSWGVAVNPVKSTKVTFERGDKIIVLAEG